MKRIYPTALIVILITILSFTTAALAQTTVTFWSWNDAIGQWIEKRAEMFNASQTEVQVVVELTAFEGFVDKAAIAIASGVGPDIVRASLPGMHARYPNDFYSPSTAQAMATAAESLPFWADLIEDDGEVYGMPWVVWPALLWYNEDMFADAGIGAPPVTWDELADVAKRLTKTGPDGDIIQSGLSLREWDFAEVFLPQVVPGFFKDGDRTIHLRGTAAEDAYTFMLELKQAGVYEWPPTAWQADQFVNGSTAMTFMGSWMLGHLHGIEDLAVSWNVAPQPRPNEDAPYGLLDVASDLRFARDVSDTVKHAGAEFLRYLYEEDNIVDLTLETGLLPARMEYYQSREFMLDPDGAKLVEAAAPVLPNSVYWLEGTSWDVVWNELGAVIWQALENNEHPEQVMLDMETRVAAALARYYGD